MATEETRAPFTLWTGVGLVVADMVGAGVFISTGYMAQSLSPGLILLAWLVGLVLALAGARTYAEVARLVPRSGGEYRYLTTLLHPALGALAGWASLLLGFSAPTAIDAVAAGAFARAAWPVLNAKVVAVGMVVALTALHAVGISVSAKLQNALVSVKVLLLLGFVIVGVAFGTFAWPHWLPPSPPDSLLANFMGNLFYIALAFSGWNAAVYAAEEFKKPDRDVPRAMLIGSLAVGVLYLVVNALFVMNLTPADGSVVFHYDEFTAKAAGLPAAALTGEYAQVTLGQAVVAHLLGPGAARVMSVVMLLLFASAMSAMLLVGPRVYAAMAKDGVLPRAFAQKEGKPPVLAVVLQGAVALALIFAYELREVLYNVGAIVTLFSALVALGLWVWWLGRRGERPRGVALFSSGIYVLSSAWMLYFGLRDHRSLLVWVGAVAALALAAWAIARSVRRKEANG